MSANLDIPVGVRACREITVTRELTVAHYHPDMPEVYGTPMMIYLMEVVSAQALHPYLPEGWVSVGAEVNVRHLAATPVGAVVTVTAEITGVDRSRVSFHVDAHDGVDHIGSGTHVRAVVENRRLLQGIETKREKLGER